MIHSDINLLPKKKKVPAKILLGVPALIALVAFIAAIAVIMPSLSLGAQKAKLDSMKKQLTTYSQVESEYQQKLKAFATIQEQEKNYNDFVSTDKETLNLLNKIKAAKLPSITILGMKFDSDKIILSGYGTTDIEIAKYEIALRNLGLFSDIQLASINGPENQRSFSYTLVHRNGSSKTASAASSQGSSAASSQTGGTSK